MGFRDMGILAKSCSDIGYFCKYLNKYGILRSILGMCQIFINKKKVNKICICE